MGPELGDSGTYGAFVPDVAESEDLDEPLPSISGVSVVAFNRLALEEPTDVKRAGGATRLEWRTPPLWGLRDSAPYLHDGRAATLEQAIALHGGEADKSSQKFFGLSAKERLEVLALLKSLTAP